ncbi:protein kinase domain-containing protein [Planctomycetaceae bacterium SH139]
MNAPRDEPQEDRDNESVDERLDELAEQYLSRVRAGESVTIDEIVAQAPELEHDIRLVLDTVRFLASEITELNTACSSHASQPQPIGDSLAVAREFGDFEIISQIGAGGMGIVYEARQRALGRVVALKVIPPSLLHDELAVRRFELEARAAASLQHPHIVPVFDVGEHAGVHFYTMQLVRGCGLNEVIQRLRERYFIEPDDASKSFSQMLIQDGLPEGLEPSISPGDPSSTSVDQAYSVASEANYFRQVAALGRATAAALAYSHRKNVIHRDIKPSNLILDADGRVWVTDFGLAKTAESDLTRTGDLVGTLRFMAPERFSGLCDRRSDIYSLGITLYELLALRPAISGDNQLSVLKQLQTSGPRPLHHYCHAVPRDLQTIIEKSIALEPNYRYQTAGEMAEDLALFVQGRPIRSRKVLWPERLLRWADRNRTLASSLAAVILLVIAGLIGSSYAAVKFRGLAIRESELSTQAQEAAKQALAASSENRRNLYAAEMQLAADASNQPTGLANLVQLLERWNPQTREPGQSSEEDLRGFEWYWLHSLAHRQTEPVIASVGDYYYRSLIQCNPRENSLAYSIGNFLDIINTDSDSVRAQFDFPAPISDIAYDARGTRLAVVVDHGRTREQSTVELLSLDGSAAIIASHSIPWARSCVWVNQHLLVLATKDSDVEYARLYLLDPVSGEVIREIHIAEKYPKHSGCAQLAVSSSGRHVAVGVTRGPQAGVMFFDTGCWDITDIQLMESHPLLSLAWHPVEDRLAYSTYDNRVLVTRPGESKDQVDAVFDTRITAVAWVPGKNELALGCDLGSQRIVAADDLRFIKHRFCHQTSIRWLGFHPWSQQFYTFATDQGLVRWRDETVPRRIIQHHVPQISTATCEVVWSPDSTLVAVSNDVPATIIDITQSGSNQAEKQFQQVDGTPFGWDSDGRFISNFRKQLTLSDRSGQQPLQTFHVTEERLQNGYSFAEVSPAENHLLMVGKQATDGWWLEKFDLLTGKAAPISSPQKSRLRCLPRWSPDGSRVAVGAGFSLLIFSVESGQVLAEIPSDDEEMIFAVAWNAAGDQIAAAGSKRRIMIYDATTFALITTLYGHTAHVHSLDSSPTEPRLASAGDDRSIIIWDTSHGRRLIHIDHSAPVRAVRWSPSGKQLTAMGQNGVSLTLDATTGYDRELRAGLTNAAR